MRLIVMTAICSPLFHALMSLENMRRASDCETAFVDVEGLAIITMSSPLFAAKANGIDRIKAGISSKILIGGDFSIENRFCGIQRMPPCRQES